MWEVFATRRATTMTTPRKSHGPKSGTANFSAAKAFGARMSAALHHARLTPADLHRRLAEVHGIDVSRSTVYDAVNGNVARTRYTMEFAEICGVNTRWLVSGEGYMFDITGRLSDKETAMRDIKRLLRQHIIPPNRADLVRKADKFLDELL
jgi:hypothetical protein